MKTIAAFVLMAILPPACLAALSRAPERAKVEGAAGILAAGIDKYFSGLTRADTGSVLFQIIEGNASQ